MNQNIVQHVMAGNNFRQEEFIVCEWINPGMLDVRSPIGGFRQLVTTANRQRISERLAQIVEALNKKKASEEEKTTEVDDLS